MPCRFVTFEGIDGSGKTSAAAAVARGMRRKGFDVVLTTEPTHTWLGNAVKRSYTEDVSPFTEAFLFMADRATHTQQILRWVSEGKLVISDRYCDSTYAYQAARLKNLRKGAMGWLMDISKPFVVEPDLTLLLDVAPRLGLQRIAPRKKKVHFENEPFLKEVRKNYLLLAKGRRFVTIDSSRNLDDVVEECLRVVLRRATGSKNPR